MHYTYICIDIVVAHSLKHGGNSHDKNETFENDIAMGNKE
jgi:hypothetical protein